MCDKGGECPLQDNTFKYGPTVSRLTMAKVKKRKAVDMGNFIIFDEERCILCRRCVRFDGEIALEGNLVVGQRAHEAIITTTDGQDFDSYFSGNTIELCPVGALTSKNYRFQARPWDLSSVPSICTGCSVGCNVRLDFRFGELVRLVAREHPDVDNGWLCDRGRFNYRYIHGEERLTRPLMRKGGQFVEVSWSEALMEIASRLRTARRDHGAGSIGFIGGGRLTNEEAYLFQKLARDVVGTPNVDHRVGGQQVASLAEYSGRIADINDADVILLVDVLPQERIPVVDLRVRRAARRWGAKLFSVGAAKPPYRVPHTHIAAAPGTTAAVLRQAAGAPGDGGPVQELADAVAGAKKVVVVWNGDDASVGAALLEAAAAWGAGGERHVKVLIPGEQANSRGAEAMGVRPDMKPGFAPVPADEAGLDTRAMLEAARDGRLQ
ncbi:MAG: molybdopterin-dependent oxidoreductase, partial [Limnochordales bacterium]